MSREATEGRIRTWLDNEASDKDVINLWMEYCDALAMSEQYIEYMDDFNLVFEHLSPLSAIEFIFEHGADFDPKDDYFREDEYHDLISHNYAISLLNANEKTDLARYIYEKFDDDELENLLNS